MSRKEGNEFGGLRSVSEISSNDTDVFALAIINGVQVIMQRHVAFDKAGNPCVSWVSFDPKKNNGYCQVPSPRYLRALEDCDGDPRSAAGNMASTYGGNPEERRSIRS